MQVHRPRQHHLLQLAPLADQVGDGVALADAHHVLLDDRPLVELRRHVVGGGADDLDAPLLGLVIGPGAGEGGEERVVDVDDPVCVSAHELFAQDLHVPRQDDKVDLLLLQHCDDALLLRNLALGRDGEAVKRHAELLDDSV